MRLIGLIVTLGLLLAPLAAEAQEAAKVARIGMLRSENRPLDDRIRQNLADVRAGLQDEGYAEGQTIESITTLRRARSTLSSSRGRWCATRST